jgi:hypothetical protein
MGSSPPSPPLYQAVAQTTMSFCYTYAAPLPVLTAPLLTAAIVNILILG